MSRNRGNSKGMTLLIFFRTAQLVHNNKVSRILFLPYLLFYRLFVEWILGVEIPWKVKIGSGLILDHGQSLVINSLTTIGNNCQLRHSTTIGTKKLSNGTYSHSPQIGNNVDIGSNTCIIGAITIGDNVTIGAGSVVVKDVPSNCIIAGNPAKIIKLSNIDG